jgi:MFS family permease
LTGSKKNISIFPILLVNFTGTLGFSIVLPFLVFLVNRFGGNAIVYGLLGASYPFFQLIGAPVLGKWSDIYGRKKILLLSEGGTLLGWIIFLTAFFLPVSVLFSITSKLSGTFLITIPLLALFIARAVDGITGGNVSVANAYIADITDEKDRTKNFGRMSVSANLGFILGPALAGILGSTVYGEMLPVLMTLIISLVSVLIIIFLLSDSRAREFKVDPEKVNIKKVLGFENKECFKMKGEDRLTLKQVLRMQGIPFILLLYFLVFLGFNFFYTAFPVHMIQKLKWTITEMGIFFSVLSVLLVIVEGPVLAFVSKRISSVSLVIAGNLILGTNFLLLMSLNPILIYCAVVLFALGNGLMWPSLLAILSKAAGEKYQGSVQGFASSAGSLASIIGLIAGGILYSSTGTFTFLVSAFVIYSVFLLSFKLLRLNRPQSTGLPV